MSNRMSRRMTKQDALGLLAGKNVFELGRMAHAERLRLHPEPVVTYIVDRNVNYTNVCVSGCAFCAFFRPPGHPEGYVLSKAELAAKTRELVDLGGYQLLLQGGMHPDLPLDFYLDMLRELKAEFPQVALHAFSAPEIDYMAVKSGLALEEVLARLMAAGLDSIPGAGAEILTEATRGRVSPNKCSAGRWLEVHASAHRAGLKTTATMMFGQGETVEERVEHLARLRDLQDASLQDAAGGFTAFIPWTFQPGNTRNPRPEASSIEYLSFLAVSRLFLDNIPNIQASWVTQGPIVGQLALFFGANDFGSTMLEENVVAAAGVHFRLPEAELRDLVERAGFIPVRRTMSYARKQ